MQDIIEKLKAREFRPLLILSAVFFIYILLTIFPLVTYFSSDGVVQINGKNYTIKDVEKDNPRIARKFYAETNDRLYRVLSEFASKKVVSLAAKERNVSEKDLLEPSIQSPSVEEMRAVYEQYKNSPALQGKSFDQVKTEIENHLVSQKKEEARNALFSELRNRYNISIKVKELPPLRDDTITAGNNPSIGPENAKVTVIEFSDFECPFCKRSQDVNAQLRAKYKDQIRWVFRDYPLSFHPNAMFAHIAANCSTSQGKYWEFFKVLFDNSGNLSKERVLDLARGVGLDMKTFSQCVNDASVRKEVEADIAEGEKYGVSGTPAFFINGIMVEGAQPIEAFTKVIDQELKN
ncbi:DsbA family protein [Leptospira borgpetersenii]|uniref:Thioredoxin-like domain protein n=1 Tax=Leptospira borgpetersenii serovar Pomona str. 200901868 TaxID=1192866 RepID=M6WGT1_LEPBO|nr:thioredoxin domain-containing protein [Leptospira borgpetersenii]EMO64399.1 thioredoxin-like domain protein [Leptospira borgpetersenii serovar Pomona str. 200901868]MBE8362526.1 DsbA family protein [Leptospira borgpetersenii serovar Balcanica]MBE8368823.1 DsbA family protein [Leptospira borgpetersenii serovar Balcanica]MBE8400674.1 DsbA family protein [Leptospira borgpetersenii serovar Tarassovi]MBE8403799.1 DsbA family protein [Leptospira borgpetersenii serovar Tarassovi]